MVDWQMWLVMAGLVVILEMFTGTFYLLMVSVGLAAGALAALLGMNPSVQTLAAAVVGVAATAVLRRSKIGRIHRSDASRDPNVNMDIGQTISVQHWSHQDGGKNTARVSYRGAMWDIELASDATAQPGVFKIQEIRGSHLIVINQSE